MSLPIDVREIQDMPSKEIQAHLKQKKIIRLLIFSLVQTPQAAFHVVVPPCAMVPEASPITDVTREVIICQVYKKKRWEEV